MRNGLVRLHQQIAASSARLIRLSHHKSIGNENKSHLLESTRLKYDESLDSAAGYIRSLVDEKQRLMAAITAAAAGEHHKSGELFTRLDYLKRVESLHVEMTSLKSDLGELIKLQESSGDDREDDEMRRLAIEDAEKLAGTLQERKIELVDLLLPEETEDKGSAVLELSAGVGGLESRIFCSELFEMYKSYAQAQNWQFSLRKVYTDNTEIGEMMRQAYVEVEGARVFEYLKFESGVHRVQRVPRTESKGRIHTSTVGVVVSPKPEEIHVELNPKDLKIETKTSGGPGGQHANKTESAVRIVHLPTGI